MKSQHWQNFTPAEAEVRNFIGGIRGWSESFDVNGSPRQLFEWDEYKSNSSIFGAISYELRVPAIMDGWHHTVSFTRGDNRHQSTNGILKSYCRPGVYQMLLHFQHPHPRVGPQVNEINNFSGAPLIFLATPSGEDAGDPTKIDDYFVARLHMFNPANGVEASLWNSAEYRGKFSLTGYPITLPHLVNPY